MTYFSKTDAAILRKVRSQQPAEPVPPQVIVQNVAPASEHVATAPPAGAHPIVNIFVDPNALELYVQFDDAADPSATFMSTPPQGSFPITNMYYNPTDGMNYIQYDDAL